MEPAWYGDGRADLPAEGGDQSTQRFSLRWGLGVVLALVMGLLVGGYVGYRSPAPPEAVQAQTARVTAHVLWLAGLRVPYPPYRLAVELANGGPRPITIEETALQVPGFEVTINPVQDIELAPGEQRQVPYWVEPACRDRLGPSASGKLRLRVRTASRDIRVLTLTLPMSSLSVQQGYAVVCGHPLPGLALRSNTLKIARPDADGLRAQLRFGQADFASQDLPGGLRFLDVALPGTGVAITGIPSAYGGSSLTAPLRLTFEIRECAAAQRAMGERLTLRVSLTSATGARLTYVDTDRKLREALQDFVRARCLLGDGDVG